MEELCVISCIEALLVQYMYVKHVTMATSRYYIYYYDTC